MATMAGSAITIDLSALADNYRLLNDRSGDAVCAACVKADAYGIGMGRAAPTLAAAGCKVFFVALPDEALALRELLPDAEIYVLNGVWPGVEGDLVTANVTPVLNSLAQIDLWAQTARDQGKALPAALHIDSGMTRLGLSAQEVEEVGAAPERLDGLELKLVMSHLACAEDLRNLMNREQLESFNALRGRLPDAPVSLANSSGIFHGAEYHFDMVRAGIALYGGNPLPGSANPMTEVVTWHARILQVRTVDTPTPAGYGATYEAAAETKIATISMGYADGYNRSLSNRGRAFVAGVEAPVIGRVSMDLITLDVTKVPVDEAPRRRGRGGGHNLLRNPHRSRPAPATDLH